MNSVLLIDDRQDYLDELSMKVECQLSTDEFEVRRWLPTQKDADPLEVFEAKIDSSTVLVITDSDLTSQGKTGLFGATIVEWCQQRMIPAVDYSRKKDGLPKEPELFEIRLGDANDSDAAAKEIAALSLGFLTIRNELRQLAELSTHRSPAAVLAAILDTPQLQNQYALYSSSLGGAIGTVLSRIDGEDNNQAESWPGILAYVVGHLLLAILRFPGPILSPGALEACIATPDARDRTVAEFLSQARYTGPFESRDRYYWLHEVERLLYEVPEANNMDFETEGALYRSILENALGRPLRKHSDCDRCAGENGGYFCPLTSRTVCLRKDCSVASSNLIPAGASLCRVEKQFYEEWAPILGL